MNVEPIRMLLLHHFAHNINLHETPESISLGSFGIYLMGSCESSMKLMCKCKFHELIFIKSKYLDYLRKLFSFWFDS